MNITITATERELESEGLTPEEIIHCVEEGLATFCLDGLFYIEFVEDCTGDG